MNKIELAVAEEIVVETIDEQAVELSLPELDMVGGGGMGCRAVVEASTA